jgi:oligopeptide/dipeptide ABC transporter ATP-binding protein
VKDSLLDVKRLRTHFYTDDGVIAAVDGVDFSLGPGETLGLVGESGCGKSVTALSVMRLIPTPPGRIAEGEIRFAGEDLLAKTESEMRTIRGNEIAMVFQEPMTSLNPVFTVGDQIIEAIVLHQRLGRREAHVQAVEMLGRVGIPSPEHRVNDYPHEMSGGMRQRVMIAISLSCNPRLLILDEPTTALDVTIQAQILDLLSKLRAESETAILLITHDLGVVAEFADRVAVMYAGQVVECADVPSMFEQPVHPYTIGLLRSIPKLNEARNRLQTIEGVVPSPFSMPEGCRFHPRCEYAMDVCRERAPDLRALRPGHDVRCFFPLV